MSVTNACPECGGPVPPDAPRGLCPRCLMAAAAASSGTVTYQKPRAPRGPDTVGTEVDRATFVDALRQLDLVPAGLLDRLDADHPGEPSRLARALVQGQHLTAYQAGALLQGKARGLVIGPYLVLDRLGVGGMGVVFKATHRPSGRVVALKILPPSFGRDSEAVRRFRREFQVASRIGHPNVVAAIEANADRGVHYLTMEYIPGYDLDRLVNAGGPMELKLALHCAIQVARGLEAAHAQGVVHRDVKPGNIMIDPAGAVRLLDLGLARVIEATAQFGRTAAGTLTQTGSYMGTVDFLAPEQADNAKAADGRADIYSLACTLYFLLTGRPPFPGETVLKRLLAHQERPAPSLRAARPEVSEELEEVYLGMMAKRPEDRPQTVSAVVLALEACRTSAREAGDASADLKTFARTALKRAPERKRRGPDASVFAKPSPAPGGLSFDPDLNLEDLVGDYRDEGNHDEIPEEKLPPIASRPLPIRPRRRRSTAPISAVALLVLFLLVAWIALRHRGEPELPSEPTTPTPPPVASAHVEPPAPPARPTSGFVPLFNGKDLKGWIGDVGDYEVRDGLLSNRPGRRAVLYELAKRSDYVARVEFRANRGSNSGLAIHYPGGFGDPSQMGLCEIQILDEGHPEHAGLNPESYTGSAFDLLAAERGHMRPNAQWNEMEVTVRGSRVKVELNGSVVLDADLATAATVSKSPHPGRDRRSGYFGLFSNAGKDGGVVEYRRIEVRDLTDAPPPAIAQADPDEPAGPAWIDDFCDPSSGWPQSSPAEMKEHGFNGTTGYDGGVWFCRSNGSAQYSWPTTYPAMLSPFQMDVTVRVRGERPNAKGAPVIHFFSQRPGSDRAPAFQIRIDEDGRLALMPSFWTAEAFPDGPWKGPITHPAIQPGGGAFNVWTVRVRKRRLEIRVNGAAVCDPIDFPWDLTPCGLQFGVDSDEGQITAEYDRVVIRQFDPAPVAGARPTDPRLGRVLFADDFGTAGRLKPGVFPTGEGLQPNIASYGAGLFSMLNQGNWAGSNNTDVVLDTTSTPFEIEAIGRVVGEPADAVGAWGLVVQRADGRGLHVAIDRKGALSVAPPWWWDETHPGDPRREPRTHPALRPADQFNRLALRVERRKAQVLVNGQPVDDPITLDYDILPATAVFLLSKPDFGTTVRVDLDRVEVRELEPAGGQ